MNAKLLHHCDDTEFGRGAPYAWPGDFEEADKFLSFCTYIESSGECLECEFYEEDDAEDVRERFKGVTEWSLPYLVTSAAYSFLTSKSQIGESIQNVRRVDAFAWGKLFFVLLTVGEPLFQMIHRNGWAEPNKESIRDGFKHELKFVIRLDDCRISYSQIQWFRERGASWFQIGAKKGRVSPENLFGCLKLAGTNETVARLAVREVFETETLYPFYTALLSAADTNFAPTLPATDEKRGGKNCDPKYKVVKFLKGDALVAKRDLFRMKHSSSFAFRGVLAIVFAIVFCFTISDARSGSFLGRGFDGHPFAHTFL